MVVTPSSSVQKLKVAETAFLGSNLAKKSRIFSRASAIRFSATTVFCPNIGLLFRCVTLFRIALRRFLPARQTRLHRREHVFLSAHHRFHCHLVVLPLRRR